MSEPLDSGQLPWVGLLAPATVSREVHTVAAHSRQRSDGTEVFVGEHLRLNRRGVRRRRKVVAPVVAPVDQISLFRVARPPDDRAERDAAPVPDTEGAVQLGLFPR